MPNTLSRTLYRLTQSARVAWFGGHHLLANRLGRKTAFAEEGVTVGSRYPDRKLFFGEMQKLFERDWKNIEDGLYAAPAAIDRSAFTAFYDSLDFLRDVPEVARRRRDQVHDEVKAEEPRQGFPDYYMQNFHFQTGGWLSDESARRYDFQVETLFAGTADAMRRQALVPIAAFLKRKDQRKLSLLDVATGTGRFLAGVKDNWPRLAVTALDLSPEYLARARKELKAWRDVRFLEANAEAMPVLNASQDIVT
ncbi:MAG: methyltransferase domain-containing protein [Alphaproteobacteria bacterium]